MRTAVIVINILGLLLLLPSLLAVGFSPMMFDAPGSEKSSHVRHAFYAVVNLPFCILVAQVISWLAFRRHNYALALGIHLLPAAALLLVFIALSRWK